MWDTNGDKNGSRGAWGTNDHSLDCRWGTCDRSQGIWGGAFFGRNDSTWLLLLEQLHGTIITPKKLSQGDILIRIAVGAVVGIHSVRVEPQGV
jgi:hypothetical protein